MPHDRDGQVLVVGDVVHVPARVKALHLTEDYCNVDLETLEPMPPGDGTNSMSLNAKQVVKADDHRRAVHR